MRSFDAITHLAIWLIFGAFAAELEKPRHGGKYSETAAFDDRYAQSPRVVQIPIPLYKELQKSRRQVNAEKKPRLRHRRRCRNPENCSKRSRSEKMPKMLSQSENAPHEFSVQESPLAERSDVFNVLEAFFTGRSIYQGNPYSPVEKKGNWLGGGYDIDSTLELVSSKSTVDSYRDYEEEDSLKKSLSSIYLDHHNPMHENLANLMTELFQSLNNNSVDEDYNLLPSSRLEDDAENEEASDVKGDDFCQRWLDSKDKLDAVFLSPLPACPCWYPSNIFYNDKIWDEKQKKNVRWRDVSGERLDVYNVGASYCVRSLLTQGSGNAAAQHCCYDGQRKLLTRGSGAGTPCFVSPEASPVLHEKIDILPWRLCKGDFSRFNKMRPPNNDNDCKSNPDDEEYQRQKDEKKFF